MKEDTQQKIGKIFESGEIPKEFWDHIEVVTGVSVLI